MDKRGALSGETMSEETLGCLLEQVWRLGSIWSLDIKVVSNMT